MSKAAVKWPSLDAECISEELQVRFFITFYELSFGAIKTRFQLLFRKSEIDLGFTAFICVVTVVASCCWSVGPLSISRRDRVRDGQIRGAGGGRGRRLLVHFLCFFFTAFCNSFQSLFSSNQCSLRVRSSVSFF